MKRRISLVSLGALLFVCPNAAYSQDRDALRAQAKTAAAQIRSLGEPKDRCTIGTYFIDGPVVIRTLSKGQLAPGDRLLAINGQSVEGKSAVELSAILRSTPPDAVLRVKARRSNIDSEFEIACSNARPIMEAQLQALDFAAAGKFDDCVSVLGQVENLGTPGVLLKTQCAATSRKSASYNLAQLTFDALRVQLEEARWNIPPRQGLIRALRISQGLITSDLGAAKFEELVQITKAWPGGENLFAASAPDWRLFKQNSETALRSRLIDPDSARFEWPRGFTYGSWRPLFAKPIDGYWTCGSINARNRMGGYTGSTMFVVVLDVDGSVKYSEIGEATEPDLLGAQCANAAKLLPPAPAEFAGGGGAPPAGQPSLADELKKLSDLRAAGAISEAEFEAAKRKLLGLPADK